MSNLKESQLEFLAAQIRERSVSVIRDCLYIGKCLSEARDLLRGEFSAWIRSELSWSRRTAYNFMSAYKRFGLDADRLGALSVSTVYLLSCPSISDEVVEYVIQDSLSFSNAKIYAVDWRKLLDEALAIHTVKCVSEYTGVSPKTLRSLHEGNLPTHLDILDSLIADLKRLVEEEAEICPCRAVTAETIWERMARGDQCLEVIARLSADEIDRLMNDAYTIYNECKRLISQAERRT